MRAYDLLDAAVALVVGVTGGTYLGMRILRDVAKESIEDYKSRWQSALDLLHQDGKITEEQLGALKGEKADGNTYNGWTLETYTQKARPQGSLEQFYDVMSIRLVKDGKAVEVKPSKHLVGVRTWEADADIQMRAYKQKAIKIAQTL